VPPSPYLPRTFPGLSPSAQSSPARGRACSALADRGWRSWPDAAAGRARTDEVPAQEPDRLRGRAWLAAQPTGRSPRLTRRANRAPLAPGWSVVVL